MTKRREKFKPKSHQPIRQERPRGVRVPADYIVVRGCPPLEGRWYDKDHLQQMVTDLLGEGYGIAVRTEETETKNDKVAVVYEARR